MSLFLDQSWKTWTWLTNIVLWDATTQVWALVGLVLQIGVCHLWVKVLTIWFFAWKGWLKNLSYVIFVTAGVILFWILIIIRNFRLDFIIHFWWNHQLPWRQILSGEMILIQINIGLHVLSSFGILFVLSSLLQHICLYGLKIQIGTK